MVGQHVTLQDDVVSHLNVSRVTEQDGGEYACVASNTAGTALHAARVNVYGLPYIREMPKVTAVAGSDLNIKCPVAGYPIESISWERGNYLYLIHCCFNGQLKSVKLGCCSEKCLGKPKTVVKVFAASQSPFTLL